MPFNQKLTETRKRKSTTLLASGYKRQRLCDQSYEADFWDGLSKIWLTKYALREFDRRIKLSAHQVEEVERPRTRGYLRKSLQQQESIEPATIFLGHCPLRKLNEIKSFARRGGPDLTELRGYPEPAHAQALEYSMSSCRSSAHLRERKRGSASSSKSKPSTNTTATKFSKKSLPADANYRQRLIDGGVFPYGYEYPDGRAIPRPSGWEDLRQRLAQSRPSLSPSRVPEDEYQKFVREDALARDESDVKDPVLPTMLSAMHASRGACKDKLFTNLEPIVAGVARPRPDYYYGTPHELIHQDVRDDLRSHIIPSDSSPAVPNFSMEAKGPDGSIAEALRQACHYGAIGARAMHSLQTYGEEGSAYDNSVRTISSVYHGGTLKMYGHSVAQPKGPGTRPEYYMHQIDTWGMTGNQRSFLKGATAYKNAMELTTEYRNAAIERANAIASRFSTVQEELEREDGGSLGSGAEVAEAPELSASLMANSANTTSDAPTEDNEDDDEDDDEDEDESESETSVETEHRRPPAKRSSTKSQSSTRRRSHRSHRPSSTSTSKGKQRKSWFGW